jgi:HK97 family phage major capsid protein
MGSGTLSIPKRTGGVTAYFVGEKEATTASDASLGSVDLVTKELSALTRISKTLDMNAVISIAAFVADEHGQAFAQKEDDCWIKGDGTSTFGGILGLKTLFDGTAFFGRIDATSGDDTFAEVISGDVDNVLAAIRSYARQGSMWLASPQGDNLVFGRLVAAGGGNTIATLNGSTGMGYLGYPREVSESCPTTTSTINDTPMFYYGNFKKGTAIGSRVGMSMQVLNERYAEYRQIGVISTEQFDLVNHDLGSTTEYGSIACLMGNT